MSLCTTAYPTSTRTTGVTWSPGMTANWTATGLRWWYNVGNVNIGTRQDFSKCLLHRFNFGCLSQSPSKECEPYRTSDGLPIAPCGAIANSLFNGKRDTVNSFAFSPQQMKRFLLLMGSSLIWLLLKALFIIKLMTSAHSLHLLNATILTWTFLCFRHSGAVSYWFQWHQKCNFSGEKGHCMVDRQACEVQEPWWKQQPYCSFPR